MLFILKKGAGGTFFDAQSFGCISVYLGTVVCGYGKGWCGARSYFPFTMAVGMEKLGQREEQVRQGCLKRVCLEFGTDAKPYKHTQTLALRKAAVIVQGEG